MKIKYVGLKADGETAFARAAGITAWMPGDSFEISNPGDAHKMLQHPDVFAVDDDKPAKAAVKATAAPPAAPATVVGETVPVTAGTVTLAPGAKVTPAAVNLDDLDKAALHAMAKERGIKVHHFANADTVRAAIKAAK